MVTTDTVCGYVLFTIEYGGYPSEDAWRVIQGGKIYGAGRRLDFGRLAYNTIHADDVSKDYTLETSIILLTNVIPINLI